MKTRTNLYLLLSIFLLFNNCDQTIHEYPINNDKKFTIEVSVDFAGLECEFDIYYGLEKQDLKKKSTGNPKMIMNPDDNVSLRFVVDLYRLDGSVYKFVERRISYNAIDNQDNNVFFSFVKTADIYKVLVWSDFVDKNTKESPYNVEDLKAIICSSEGAPKNKYKDAFTAVEVIDFRSSETDKVVPIILNRSLARYRFIATDVEKSDQVEGLSIEVTYKQYISSGYNVEDQLTNKFEFTRNFTSKASLDKDGTLVYDYVLANERKSNVLVDLSITDKNGKQINQCNNIIIPLIRNKETVIRGNFLTESFGDENGGGGGLGIDDKFENEVVIPIN